MLTGGRILLVVVLSLGLAVASLALLPGRPEATVLPAAPAPVAAQQAPEPQLVQVLAAAADVAAGATIGAADLGSLGLPVSAAGAFLADTPDHRAALAGQPATRALPVGSPLLASDLPQPVMAAQPLLQPGFRAMAVPVSAETGVAGLIGIGDRVDVLLAFRLPDGSPVVRIILQNARVLAVDQTTEVPALSAANAPLPAPRTVTLELTSEAAKVLTLAGQIGILSLALTGDVAGDGPLLTDDVPLLASDLAGLLPELAAALPAAAAPRAVEIVRGGNVRSQDVFRAGTLAPATSGNPTPDFATPDFATQEGS